MKGLLVSHDFLPGLPGGIAFFYHNLCRQWQDEIQVLVPQCGDWQTFDRQQPYIVHRRKIPIELGSARRTVRLNALFLLKACWLALVQFSLFLLYSWQIIRQEKIDYLLIGHLYQAPLGWLVRLLTRRPYGIILHGSELQRYWHLAWFRRIILFFLNRANFLVVNSHFTQQQYLERGVRPTQRFIQIYPGVDVDRFRPEVDANPIRRRHDLDKRPVILTISRLVQWKGQDTVIRAMPQVLQAIPNAIYVIGGKGPYQEQLQALAQALDVRDHVIFAGFIPDEELAQYYKAADVMVMVSREVQLVETGQAGVSAMPIEGFGMVYVEANATGLPVIGGRIGATSESIAPNETGLLVDPHNEQEVAAAIIRLLQDPALAQRMGQAGRARAEREFTWQTQAGKFRQQLNTLLNGDAAA